MAKKDVAVVVLAAGKGVRMASSLPKVLHKIAGVSMLRYVFSNIAGIAPKKTVVVIGPGMKSVESEAKTLDKTAKCVIQKNQKGTGDAVATAKGELKGFKGNILILFGDTPFVTSDTMNYMLKMLESDRKPALVVLGFTPDDPAEYGRMIVDDEGNLLEIKEFKDASEEERQIELCNAGVMAVRGELLFDLLGKVKTNNAKGEYYLTDLVKIARKAKHTCIGAEAEAQEVMGINTRDQLADAEAIVQHYLRWEAMSGGATLIAPETVFLNHDTKIGRDVIIHPNVVFGHSVTIEDNVEIKPFTYIEGATIKSGAVIGPYARIRPGTVVGENARVGNFVEIKNSKLGKGAKASHLSYIGDTEVGDDANIGAGTITCNYDGKNKYKTRIGKNAFIGSNTSLIAPVTIGEGAIIGAGSTITKDVKKGAKVINVMPQKELGKGSKKKK